MLLLLLLLLPLLSPGVEEAAEPWEDSDDIRCVLFFRSCLLEIMINRFDLFFVYRPPNEFKSHSKNVQERVEAFLKTCLRQKENS